MSLQLQKLQSLNDQEDIRDTLFQYIKQARLNPYSFELLEYGLFNQIQNDWFEPEFMLGLLKLIQFFPKKDIDCIEIIKKVLLKSLSELPLPTLEVTIYFV